MSELVLTLPELHPGQEQLRAEAKRFNVVACGRRWGKTVTAEDLMSESGIDGKRCAYFAPTYKMLNEVWKEMVVLLAPIIAKKDAQQKQLTFLTGGLLDFWSLDNMNSARGRKYHRVIVDEAAYVVNLLEAWQKALRPMLTDYAGDAWFLSSPNGEDSDFHTLFTYADTNHRWQSFQMPTSTNPYIPPGELVEAQETLPADVYAQEYGAQFVRFNGRRFASEFSREKHVAPRPFDARYDATLCFDFNNANTCLIRQDIDGEQRWVKEFHYTENLDKFCLDIRQWLEGQKHRGRLRINGDASGGASTANNNEGLYDVIRGVFQLQWSAFKIQPANPSHRFSMTLTNVVLKNAKVVVDPSCGGLIADFEKVVVEQVGPGGKLQIVKKDPKRTHWIDPVRYSHYVNEQPLLKRLGLATQEHALT